MSDNFKSNDSTDNADHPKSSTPNSNDASLYRGQIAQLEGFLWNISYQHAVMSEESSAYPTSTPSTSDANTSERPQRFNKESRKVNAGLPVFSSTMTPAEDTTSAWASNKPVVDIDFSQFVVPTIPTPPHTRLSAAAYVAKLKAKRTAAVTIPTSPTVIQNLLSPPPHAFVHGVLSINWVISAVERQHFVARERDGRLVLKQNSEVRQRGERMGVRGALLGWLCGDDEEVSAAEEGVCLTKEYFEGEG